jgi:signal transduction histidine kinase/AraC-like DNA-binding protein
MDMEPGITEDVAELRHDALAMLVALSACGWVALLVGTLVYHEITKADWPVLPLLLSGGGLLAAHTLHRSGRLRPSIWCLVAGMLAGPVVFTLMHGLRTAVLGLFVLPIVAVHILLPPRDTVRLTAFIGALLIGLALGQPDRDLRAIAAALGQITIPFFLCLSTAAMLFCQAFNVRSLVEWALDSQRKDARRAELFRQQQEQLRRAMTELEAANFQLRVLNVQLAEARRAAEVANQLKTRFLANVSHELRAPLHVILGLTGAALEAHDLDHPALSPTLARDLHHIHQSGTHLSRLINDLLDLSRAEINALELYPETIDPRALLVDVFTGMADSQEHQRAVTWQLELPARLPLIQADPVRLRQILFNLLSNAAKFTTQGTIRLGAAVEPPYLHLWVADTGCGIPLDQQERIFEPFATDRTRKRPDGAGLGLSITYRLVALHQGSLTLESQPGLGSTFHVYLPLPDLTGQAAQPLHAGEPILLLISSRSHVAPEVRAIAQRQGLPLRQARDLPALREQLSTGQPVGVIWDLSDATIDDWPMIEHLRSRPELCCIPLLLYSQDGGRLPNLTTGVTEVLVKPLAETTLIQSVHALHPSPSEGPILIVDDDPLARRSYRAVLTAVFPQHTVLEAADGAEALAMLQHIQPSLVILDLIMPQIDGFAVLEALRTHAATQRTPVLVLSGRVLAQADVERLRYSHVTFHSKETLSRQELVAQTLRIIQGENALAPATSQLVKQALAYIHQHYDRALTRHEIASYVGVNERYLTDIFHQELGMTLWDYLNRFRVAQAKHLLITTHHSITEIAAQVGFENAASFTRLFRRLVGTSPRAYRAHPPAPVDASV